MESAIVQWSVQVPVYVVRAGGISGGDAERHVDQSISQWCIVSSTLLRLQCASSFSHCLGRAGEFGD